jgi:hypothetical protein
MYTDKQSVFFPGGFDKFQQGPYNMRLLVRSQSSFIAANAAQM